MKFSGLILICAASSLALLLPATGLVKFPMSSQPVVQTPPESGSRTLAVSLPAFSMAVPNATGGAAPPGTGGALPNPSPEGTNSWSKQTVGLGIWLFLGPVALLGLAIWTFSPGPRNKSSQYA
jgi:hypothetical protein